MWLAAPSRSIKSPPNQPVHTMDRVYKGEPPPIVPQHFSLLKLKGAVGDVLLRRYAWGFPFYDFMKLWSMKVVMTE